MSETSNESASAAEVSAIPMFVKDFAVRHLVTIFLLGGLWGGMSLQNAARDKEILDSKAAAVELKHQVEENKENLALLKYTVSTAQVTIGSVVSDTKVIQSEKNKFEVQVGIMSQKLDDVNANLSKLSAKLDEISSKK